MRRFFAVLVARNLEFVRDRATLIWNLALPVFLIFGFAFAFSGNKTTAYKIGTLGDRPPVMQFLEYKYLKFIPYPSEAGALKKLGHHQLDMVVDFGHSTYFINQEAPGGYLVEKLLQSDRSQSLVRKTVTGKRIRYIDWFVPGVIGMNILFGCLFGVGYVIVRYRKNGVLKRFKATPLHAIEFVTAQVFSRFLIVAITTIVVFEGTNLFLHFRMEGSYLLLGLVAVLGILCHISIGLFLAARIKSEEVAGGLMNMLTFPMMIMSGIFFSLEGTPKALQVISKFFPITHFVDACRAIMLDGAGFAAVGVNMAVLAGSTVLFLFLSALIFKWE